MTKSNRKTPLVFRIGLALVCALLVSTYMMSGMYARYCTTASGDDSARIAKFSVDENDQWDSVDVNVKLNFYNPAQLESTLEFSVTSDSEVAVQYDVIVTLPDGLAPHYEWLVLTLSRVGEEPVTATCVGNVYTITAAGTFAANDAIDTHNCTLTFAIADAYQGNPPAGLENFVNNIQLTVHAEQID